MEKNDNTEEEIGGVQRLKNLLTWATLRYSETYYVSKETVAEKQRQEARKTFSKEVRSKLGNYYADQITGNSPAITKKTGDKFLEKFKDDGLTKEILQATSVTRGIYVVGMSVSLDAGNTMDNFVAAAFESFPFIEIATPCLGSFDCVFIIFASAEEITSWLHGNQIKELGAKIVSTTTIVGHGKACAAFPAKQHPNYLLQLDLRSKA